MLDSTPNIAECFRYFFFVYEWYGILQVSQFFNFIIYCKNIFSYCIGHPLEIRVVYLKLNIKMFSIYFNIHIEN